MARAEISMTTNARFDGTFSNASGASSLITTQLIAPEAIPSPTGTANFNVSRCRMQQKDANADTGWGRLDKKAHNAARLIDIPLLL
mmetsp:Transcript_144208/g.251354  ORF Transcript_144208/g.251354 Transcript_144208/m.251354 type:complete len:86 (+) Transcript_144208:78-335(+)